MLNNIKEALEDIKNGKMLIVVDDEDRENEGDLIIPAQMATYESINFMAKEARGLICVPIEEEKAKRLALHEMVQNNTDELKTAFTVSVDHISTSTGISISDRLATIKALANPLSKVEDFKRPGHIFPLIAKNGGVLTRNGHTEAAIDLARLAGLEATGVICEILNDDGTMARLPQLKVFAQKHNLKIISIADLIEYRKNLESIVTLESEAIMPTKYGDFILKAYKNTLDDKEHMALVKGDVENKENVKIRIHSECFTGDILGSLRCDCGNQLQEAMRRIEEDGSGVIIYMRQEGRGIGIYNKLKAYNLQDKGLDTVEANVHLGFAPDLRDYTISSAIIKELGIKSVNLLTNNPSKIKGLENNGIKVDRREGVYTELNSKNLEYFNTKVNKMKHIPAN